MNAIMQNFDKIFNASLILGFGISLNSSILS